MPKICLIQKELKDKNFVTGAEQIDFQILKSLADSDYELEVFCQNNSLSKKIKSVKVLELTEEYFFQTAFSMANKMNYDLTFSTDYFPANIVYLNKHTRAYTENSLTKIQKLFRLFFKRKEYRAAMIEMQKQKISATKNDIIFTPSMTLKNDLINNLHIDGQKIYILPPAVNVSKNVKIKMNETFTFGFIGTDFIAKGGLFLLLALKNLVDFDFNLKMIYGGQIPKWINLYLKYFKLDNKVEILPYQEDMNDFYKGIDCLLVPSNKDTFSLSVLEAMSRGKIVLLSSKCGAKDIIEPDNNGFIFDITNKPVRNLVRGMEYILINKDDFDGMQQKAVYTASVYNFEKFKAELTRVIDKITAGNTEEQ